MCRLVLLNLRLHLSDKLMVHALSQRKRKAILNELVNLGQLQRLLNFLGRIKLHLLHVGLFLGLG